LLTSCALIALLAALSNSVTLVHGSQGLRADSVVVTGDLRAVELAGHGLPSTFQPVPQDAPQIFVGEYLAAVASLGSPADSNAQLLAAPETVRASADALLAMAIRPSVVPIAARKSSDATTSSFSGLAGADCQPENRSPGNDKGSIVQLRLASSGLLVSAPTGGPVEIRLRLLASQFPVMPTVAVPAGTTAVVAPRVSLANLPTSPWWAELSISGKGIIRACELIDTP
jgi:hypothetical protein